jgi:hypothetical protein
MDDYGAVLVRFIDSSNKMDKRICAGGFKFCMLAAYYPEWAQPFSLLGAYGLLTQYPNNANLKFNIVKKSSLKPRRNFGQGEDCINAQ